MPTPGTSPQQPYGYILIVETDDLIRELLERWLGEAGHAVVAASSGTPAREEAPKRY
jgi:DNA-binding response OmpR family regulator